MLLQMPRALARNGVAFARRWKSDKSGVAAVEFAMIVPIMFFMFIGAVEISQAITVDRRVTQVASSMADLVARKETSITQTEMGDITKIGSYIMMPYSQTPLQVVVRNVLLLRGRNKDQAVLAVHIQGPGLQPCPDMRVHERNL